MIIILVTAAAVITAGAYLHWAVAPVTAAYRLGTACGRMAQAAGASEHGSGR